MTGADRLLTECVTQWRDHGHHVVAIVSDHPSMIAWAARESIVCLDSTSSPADTELPHFDYLFHLSNPPVSSPKLLAMPRCAMIHLHDGPSPGYAGLHPPIWALLNGKRRHGISWRLMTKAPDDGDVLLTRDFDIDDDDSAMSMHAKCFIAARGSFADLITGLSDGTLMSQTPERKASHSHGLDPRPAAAGMIDWHCDAHAIAHMVRALDHGCHANLLTAPKISLNGHVLLVGAACVQSESSGLPPGTILSIRPEGMVVATATRDVRVGRITTCSGQRALLTGLATRAEYRPGAMLDLLSDQQRQNLSSLTTEVARLEPWWRERLARRKPLRLPLADGHAEPGKHSLEHIDQAGLCSRGPRSPADRTVMAALVAYLARIADQSGSHNLRFDLGYVDPVMLCPIAGFEPWFATQFPLDVMLDLDRGLSVLREALGTDIRQIRRKVGHAADLFARMPGLQGEGSEDPSTLPVVLQIVDRLEQATPHPGADLTLVLRSDSSACRWLYPPARLKAETVSAMQDGFATFLAAASAAPDLPLGTLPLATPHGPEMIIAGSVPPRGSVTGLHQLFAQQVVDTPEHPAITCREQTWSYAELDQRADRLACRLRRLGLVPESLVGLHMQQSLNMVAALIAIHKAGGGCVPLHPCDEPGRIARIMADCHASVILTDPGGMTDLAGRDTLVLSLDDDWFIPCEQTVARETATSQPHHLAYVAHSPTPPETLAGTMIEHHSRVDIMPRLDRDMGMPGGSVYPVGLRLECCAMDLYRMLSRGEHVILDEESMAPAKVSARPLDFSISCFPGSAYTQEADRYRLLLECAKFADDHGYTGIWTPTHHFHIPDGRYPDPALASAAIAAVALFTKRVQIRAGSVVFPSHHPFRVAEEWALIDNLSHGRVAVAATGCFHQNPHEPRSRAAARFSQALKAIATLRSFWRGSEQPLPGLPGGETIHPRPIQPDLPVWIAPAEHDDTFVAAGNAQTFVLTHLLAQSIEDLAARIVLYRAAWKARGHAGDGHVSLLLPTFLGHDVIAAHAALEVFLKDQKGTRRSTDHALIGSPRDCLDTIRLVQAAGVDEIAFMIDFGLPTLTVLNNLPGLNELREISDQRQAIGDPDQTGRRSNWAAGA